MKRIIAAILLIICLLGLCACGDSSTTGDPNTPDTAIDSALTGKWYGPNNDPILNITENGTGTAEYQGNSFEATFSAENGVFSVNSEGYTISGGYELSGEQLTVTITYDEKEYSLVFTRKSVTLPENSCVFSVDDTPYELNPEEGVIYEVIFPPDKPRPRKKIYLTETTTINIYNVHVTPPPGYGNGGTVTNATEEPETPDGPEIPVPEVLDFSTTPPKVTIGGKELPADKSSFDIVGTWTNANMDTTIDILGVQTETTTSIVYTFNADGTGTVIAMGFIPGTFTYTCDKGVLNLTVSMLGQVESGTGYVWRIGDKLYVQNMDKEILLLTKSG